MQKGHNYIEFWPIFIFYRIELIFGRLTCFDTKIIVPWLFWSICVLFSRNNVCKKTHTTRSMYVKNHVKKCVNNVCFSHLFHMFFTTFHMNFTLIFHTCVKNYIVKHVWKGCEVMSTLSHTFSPAFHHMVLHTNFTCKFSVNSYTISHASSHKFHLNFTCKFSVNRELIKFHMLIHPNFIAILWCTMIRVILEYWSWTRLPPK